MAGMNERVGEKIRQAREVRGLTQAELAKHLGYSQNTVAGWETGRRACRLETLQALSSITGFPMGFFLDTEDRVAESSVHYVSGASLTGSSDLDALTKVFQGQIDQLQRTVTELESIVKDFRSDLASFKSKPTDS